MDLPPDISGRIEDLYDMLMDSGDLSFGDRLAIDREDLELLCQAAQGALTQDSTLIELKAPVTIFGDIHGQFTDLLQFLKMADDPKTSKMLFLGDYVDRGPNSIEVISLVFCMKVLFPKSVFLLRGNHEDRNVCASYGFLQECEERYDTELFELFTDVFQWIPLAARINSCVFCVHGGIAADLELPDDIDTIHRPVTEPMFHEPVGNLVAEVLWSDPSAKVSGYQPNTRGVGHLFGPDVCKEWMQNCDVKMLVRAHEVVHEGIAFPFKDCPDPYKGLDVVTVFSAPNYGNVYGNRGGIMFLDRKLHYSFQYITPLNYVPDVQVAFSEYSESDESEQAEAETPQSGPSTVEHENGGEEPVPENGEPHKMDEGEAKEDNLQDPSQQQMETHEPDTNSQGQLADSHNLLEDDGKGNSDVKEAQEDCQEPPAAPQKLDKDDDGHSADKERQDGAEKLSSASQKPTNGQEHERPADKETHDGAKKPSAALKEPPMRQENDAKPPPKSGKERTPKTPFTTNTQRTQSRPTLQKSNSGRSTGATSNKPANPLRKK